VTVIQKLVVIIMVEHSKEEPNKAEPVVAEEPVDLK
jgi:hypothetical protein